MAITPRTPSAQIALALNALLLGALLAAPPSAPARIPQPAALTAPLTAPVAAPGPALVTVLRPAGSPAAVVTAATPTVRATRTSDRPGRARLLRGTSAVHRPTTSVAPARLLVSGVTAAASASVVTVQGPLWLRRAHQPAAVAPAPVPPVAAVTTAAAPTPSGVSAPIGDLPGWKQVFVDDFTTAAPLGTFLTSPAYKDKWTSYNGYGDTSGVGLYAPDRVLSVSDGALDMYLHTENGRALGAAPIPLFDGKWSGQTYGRFSIRFRSDPLPGYGAGWLLWPNSDNWNEGEIDFPEGDLDKQFWAHNHCLGNPELSCWDKDTHTSFTGWHTATIEWVPGGVTFLLDGVSLGTSNQAPSTRMHLVLQTATTGVQPAASTAGHVQIDWVSIWTRTA